MNDESDDEEFEVSADKESIEGNPLFDDLEVAMQAANAGDYEKAIEQCYKTIKAHPSASEPYFLLGVVAFICRDEGQAISMCETAHRIDPDIAEYADALAAIYTNVGQLADGLYFAKLAPSLTHHPLFEKRMPPRLKDLKGAFDTASPSTHFIEAQRLFNVGDFDRSLIECTAEIRLNPEKTSVYILLARAAIISGKFTQAVGAMQAAIHLESESGMASALLARALANLGRYEEAAAAARRAIQLADTDAEVFYQAMDAMQRCPSVQLTELKNLAEDFNQRFDEENDVDNPEAADRDAEAPVHVGFLSNRFFRMTGHGLFDFWFGLPARKSVSYAGYQQSVNTDYITTAVKKGCDSWREIYDLDPFTMSYILREEELDVIVDLSGPDGETRQTTIAMRPCNVRVGAFALLEPGLAPGITHVLSDETLEAADKAALLSGQECAVISGTLFAHQPFTGLPQDHPSALSQKGSITFGAMAELALMSPETAVMWADVLHAVPNSQLLLCGADMASDDTRLKIREYFSHAGVADRVLLPSADDEPDSGISDLAQDEDHDPEDLAQKVAAELAPIRPTQLQEVDVFLDSYPVNCCHELAQALWMGIPCVTLKGKRRPSAVGASILAAAGRLGWIAQDPANFVKIASGLASNTDSLELERKSLQENVATSPLFDVTETATNIRNVLEKLGQSSAKPSKES